MNRKNINILVVDDVNSVRTQIKAVLEELGFESVITAADGDEAKIILDTNQFHLILSDLHMAPTDGITLVRYVRNHPILKDTAFIMVSGDNTVENVMKCISAGVDDYLIKPLSFKSVEDKVVAVLKRRGHGA